MSLLHATPYNPIKSWLHPSSLCTLTINSSCQGDPIPDWKDGDPEPAWEPICGGQGYSGKPAASTLKCPDYSQLGVGGTPDAGQSAADTAACKVVAGEFRARPKGEGTFGGNGGLLNGSGNGGSFNSSGNGSTIAAPGGNSSRLVGMSNAGELSPQIS